MSTTDSALGTQSYRERLPGPGLARHVTCLWVQRVASGREAYRHRTVPNGGVEIVCDLGTGVARVVGPRRGAVVERLAPGSTVIGARLRAGAAPSILGPAALHLVDLEVDLDALWGAAAVGLGERLAEAGLPAAVLLLEKEIAARSATAPDLDPVVAEAVRRLRPWSGEGVNEAAVGLYISPRQLRRRCLTALGYGPKAFQRILRFQGFLALCHKRDGDGIGLARLAAVAGYADQAHLTRECARLTGLTPGAFLEETGRSCGTTHDHTASFAPLLRALGTRPHRGRPVARV